MMKTQQTGSFVTGLVVGLLIGLGVALAVALYITKAPVPFINKLPQRSAEQDAAEFERNKAWDPNAPLAGKNPARPATVASGAVDNTAAPLATASQPPLAASAPAKPGRDPAAILAAQPAAAPDTAVAVAFFVQAGAYAKSEDAEAQRAKLALLGLAAKVSEREQAGRTVYRVRLGPFDQRAAAEEAQGKLVGAGIDANLVRVER
jgi:cell division protein FtsN